MPRRVARLLLGTPHLVVVAILAACSGPAARRAPTRPDAGSSAVDAGEGLDAGPALDAGPEADAGPDAGMFLIDAGAVDAGPVDAGFLAQVLTPSVNPFIGTAAGAPDYGLNNARGDTFPGALVPFGMVQLSPDTTTAPGGYNYADSTIYGFSATHFSGRGISCYQDVPLMPTIGTIPVSPGTNWHTYGSPFQHGSETAQPGYYAVTLDLHQIGVELTATTRTGMLRIAFPAVDPDGGARPQILVNTGGSANGDETGTGVEITGPSSLTGTAVSGNCGGSFLYTLYYAAEFDRPFAASGTWNGGTLTAGSTSSVGVQSGAYLTFAPDVGTVQVKFGLSWVSVAQAQANLAAENPAWDFDALRAGADTAWEERLNRVQVTGGSSDERAVFYTALYHAQIHPSIFSDVDGQYIGFDQQLHRNPDHAQFHNFPGWDNYRSEMRLLPLIASDLMPDMMQSLVNDATQDPGGGLPRWEHANCNSGGMIGDSQDVVLAGAYAFGITGFDSAGAAAAIRRGAEIDTTTCTGHTVREGLDSYLQRGWVDTNTGSGGSRTLEYVSDDFAASRLLTALGDSQASTYLTRSHNWQNLWNPADGYLEARAPDGTFAAGFNPLDGNGWTEGDGAQYLWMVPFDLGGLISKLGGPSAAMARLDTHVSALNAGPGSAQLFIGNEPEEGTPWVYDWGQQPWKTQALVRNIWLQQFANAPGGYPGNDDGGALASWVVFAALGLYPEIPGVAGFAVGSPLFREVRLQLPHGVLHITAPGAADASPYVQSLSLNGQSWPSPWIDYAQLSAGAELAFDLGATANTTWGSDPSVVPPSFE